ncbi:MAG: hypothetical protein JF607_05055 [Burkholderiales bacterium]|jgi:LuxR family maltose regulon positive regulatory protein|nr:hypothetical protein [Burkholderiales bacterium]
MSLESPAFARAKIQAPRLRPGLVERPRLEAALGRALVQQRVTLLQAPAGFGKTAALTRQLRQLPDGSALAWVSADEDDDVQRFLACLTAALEPFGLPWRVAPQALATLVQAERGLRRAADEIANVLAAAEVPHGLIVIDDVHRLADPQVLMLLEALVERLQPPWGLVLASRSEPDLSLARLRASDELAEFRQVDLRFDEQEVEALMAQAGYAAGRDRAAELLQRTDGWAVGLRLSLATLAAPLQGRATAQLQARRHLFDYLASEVLSQMPGELRDFLLRSSVLPELTAARCARLLQLPLASASRLLGELERRGLFVSALDDAELTLRLHDLVRDFLDDEFERRYPDELPVLLRRAAEDEPDLVRAVGWLARAGDWNEAARRMEEQGASLVGFGGISSLSHLLALFPQAQMASRPEMLLLRALVAFMKFEFETMRDSSVAAAREFERLGQPDRAVWANVMVGLAMESTGQVAQSAAHLAALPVAGLDAQVRALTAFSQAWAEFGNGRAENAPRYFETMLQVLEEKPDVALWSQVFFHSILTGVPGMRPLLERFDEGAMRLVRDVPCQLRAGVFNSKAWLAIGRGELQAAYEWSQKADEDTRWIGSQRSVLTETLMSRAMIEAVHGRSEAAWSAHAALMSDMQAAPPSNRLTHNYELVFTGARIAWLLGELDQLPRWEAELRAVKNSMEWPLAELDRQVCAGMLAASRGEYAEAARLLRTVALAPERSNFFIGGQSLWMLADVLARSGALDEAAEILRPWLDDGLAGRDVGAAILAGAEVLKRVLDQRWGSRMTPAQLGLVRRLADTLLRARAPERAKSVARPSLAPAANAAAISAGADYGLTERELEVLSRIAAGESNKLIARALDLSPFTVKRHVANILDKLAVSSRGQAAAAWRDLNN